jgi:hypothetical protein
MNPFFSMMQRNPMMNMLQQVQQIRQNPSQLASLLQQRGLINPQQAQEIQKMGNHYGQIGQYLMNSGSMPNNIPQNTIDQAQTIAKQQ